MSDNTLRFRQEVYDVWTGKSVAFKEVVAEHDKKFNPTGATFKVKREAPETSVDAEAIVIKPGEGEPKTKDEVAPNYTFPGSDATFELLVKDGSLWLHALSDTVVADSVPLGGFGAGHYEVGDAATTTSQKSEKWIEFHWQSDEVQCVFNVAPPGFSESYPDKPTSLRKFLQWLEGQGQIKVSMGNHEATRVGEGPEVTYTIKRESFAVFVLLQKFSARQKPTRETFCALLDLGRTKQSTRARLVQSCTYAREGNAIKPGYFYLFLARPVRLTRGAVAKVV